MEHAPPGQLGQFRGSGEGQGHFHGPQALLSFRLIQDRGFQQAGKLPFPILGLLPLEEKTGLPIQHLPNVRTGIRHDHLCGLFPFQCRTADGLPSPHGLLPEFQFHHCDQSFLVSSKYLSHPMWNCRQIDLVPRFKYGRAFSASLPRLWVRSPPPSSWAPLPSRA